MSYNGWMDQILQSRIHMISTTSISREIYFQNITLSTKESIIYLHVYVYLYYMYMYMYIYIYLYTHTHTHTQVRPVHVLCSKITSHHTSHHTWYIILHYVLEYHPYPKCPLLLLSSPLIQYLSIMSLNLTIQYSPLPRLDHHWWMIDNWWLIFQLHSIYGSAKKPSVALVTRGCTLGRDDAI